MKRVFYFGICLVAAGCGGSGSNVQPVAWNESGSSESGNADGPLATARFNNPVNVAVAGDGTVYVADFDNSRIRRISREGIVSTVVDNSDFVRPFGLALSGSGDLFIQTDANSTGTPSPTNGSLWRLNTRTNNLSLVAENLGRPRGLEVLSNGEVVTTDVNRHIIRIVNPSTGATRIVAGADGVAGFANGTSARFNRPYGIALAPNGTLIVADSGNNRIRRVDLATGVVSTVAGSGEDGAADGAVASATFDSPQDVAVALDGSIYVADTGNYKIRRVRAGIVSTVAGSGVRGYAPGSGLTAQFWGLEGLALHPDGSLIVADGTGGEDNVPYHRVRKINVR